MFRDRIRGERRHQRSVTAISPAEWEDLAILRTALDLDDWVGGKRGGQRLAGILRKRIGDIDDISTGRVLLALAKHWSALCAPPDSSVVYPEIDLKTINTVVNLLSLTACNLLSEVNTHS